MFLVIGGYDRFYHNNFLPLDILTLSCHTPLKAIFFMWWHMSSFTNEIYLSFKFIFQLTIEICPHNLVMLKYNCLILFKVCVVKMGFFGSCSLIILTFNFFFKKNLIMQVVWTPHMYIAMWLMCKNMHLSGNLWISLWNDSILGHVKKYSIHIRWACQKIFPWIFYKISFPSHAQLFTK
jgi:hypothetical protein